MAPGWSPSGMGGPAVLVAVRGDVAVTFAVRRGRAFRAALLAAEPGSGGFVPHAGAGVCRVGSRQGLPSDHADQ